MPERTTPFRVSRRAYAFREGVELGLILLGLGIADGLTVIPWWIWLAIPLGKTATSIGFYFVFLRSHLQRPPRHDIAAMIGRRAQTVTALTPRGQVKINGEIWGARVVDGGSCPAATVVEVRGIEETTLLVDRLDA